MTRVDFCRIVSRWAPIIALVAVVVGNVVAFAVLSRHSRFTAVLSGIAATVAVATLGAVVQILLYLLLVWKKGGGSG